MGTEDEVGSAQPQAAKSEQRERWLARLANVVRWDTVSLLAVIGVALTVRVVRLDSVPVNVTADETDFLRDVYHIFAGKGPGLFGFDWTPSPALGVYLIAATMKVFGASIMGARMCPVLLSMGTLVAFFFLARERLSYLASLLAALLLATNLWFLHFSRTAWTNMNGDLFAVAGTLMLALAIRKERWQYYAAAGIFAALGIYGYSSANFVILLFLAYLPFALFLNRDRARRILQGYAILLVACFLAFLPQINPVVDNWETFTHRARFTYIFNQKMPYYGETDKGQILLRQTEWTARAFLLIDDSGSVMNHGLWKRYIPPGWGLLDPFARGLFLVGMVAAAWKWRQTVLWWIMFLGPVFAVQVFTGGTPDAARGLIAVPFMFLFVGEGIELVLSAGHWLGARARWAGIVVVLVLGQAAAFSATANVREYFDWMNTPEAIAARKPATSREAFPLWQRLEQEAAREGLVRFDFPRWCALQIATGGVKDEQTAIVCRDMVPEKNATCARIEAKTASERDQQRRSDIDKLGAGAIKYRAAHGRLPSTDGKTQPLCAYPRLDAGCMLEQFMQLQPTESLADTDCFPYLYASDGTSFTLYAVLETAPADGELCTEKPELLSAVEYVYCVKGP